MHLKASDGETERQRRLQEVMVLRNVTDNLPTTANFMIVGDYNIYYSDEPAFQELIKTSRGSGYVKDPINRLGNWHNNASFADIFTQSTRVNGGAGSGGGVDDRFDMMLLCENLLSPGGIDYVSNSYTAYGNDGLHFNQAINNGQNGVVDTDVANALHDASDHMPVLLKLRFGVPTGIRDGSENLPDTPQLFDNYPNPFNPGTNIRFALPSAQDIQLNIYNARGQQVRSLANGNYLPGNHNLFWDATNDNGERVASGVYFYQLRAGVFQQSQKMLLIQ
ncbi:MAG: FlgD immunoglobulin-like domain containing protein [Calditrichia bacterium]